MHTTHAPPNPQSSCDCEAPAPGSTSAQVAAARERCGWEAQEAAAYEMRLAASEARTSGQVHQAPWEDSGI